MAAALTPVDARGWCRTTTSAEQPDPLVCPSEGVPIAWAYPCVAMHIDPRLPAGGLDIADLRTASAASIEAWSTVRCDAARRTRPGFLLHLLGDLEVPVGYFEGEPNASTVSVRATWGDDAFHSPNAAALTVVTFTSGSASIVDTDVEVNARGPDNPQGLLFTLQAGDPNRTDLQSVLTHEFGHAQGLAHSPERTAVMWATVGRAEARRTPSADDAQGLCAVYPPRATSACDPTLRGLSLYGRGLGCGARPSGADDGAMWALSLAVLAFVRSRRGAIGSP